MAEKISWADLEQFTGTAGYHRWSGLFRNIVLTDGAKFLAEQAKAYWLMDAIASWQTKRQVRVQPFQVWRLTKVSKGWVLRGEDGNDNTIAEQRIEYSDFPEDLSGVKLYAEWSDGVLVILLPSEH